ncbi:TetR/AcrR family transcriptional regulator [Mycobacterium sp. E796]|uniref:TetR/AcrR family transcriptional regulator n=1 Tax=Mycobacterium sp. E796 TaxID=1834151 RepID=UPI000A67D992|nr:TetR/AcrR family transcriptional regulator [Mycobacterium sp. E796]
MDARIVRTRAALVGAAIALVDEHDPDQISMADIAAAAGISRQAIYDHFTDRDHLLAEAAISRIREATRRDAGPTRVPADGSPPQSLIVLMTHLLDHRVFYQRLLTGRTSAVVRDELTRHNRFHFERMMMLPGPGRNIPVHEQAELVTFLAGGSTALIVGWLTDDNKLSTARVMADRLWQLWTSLRPVATG